MSETAPLVTAADISRLAGVTRATVSNWRRRHPGFPSPAGGNEARPVFDLAEVQQWLRDRGFDSTESPLNHLRTVLRAQVAPTDIPALLAKLAPAGATLGPPVAEDGKPEVMRAVRAAVDEAGLGPAIEVLAERGLEESPTTGVYTTPGEAADLIAALARPSGAEGGTVLDPACGSGALLAAAARLGARECYGQDILPVQAQRAALNVAVDAPQVEVTTEVGDSLLADAFPDIEADAVLCNPPNQQRDWGADELALDPRWTYGVPPRGESELAWVQHALAHLRPGGTAVLLLPPAVASRGAGRRIRGELLRQGVLRAVIGLPAGVAPPRQLGLHLWVLRGPTPGDDRTGDVLFVDAARLDPASDPKPGAVRDLTETVLEAWRNFDEGSSEKGVMPDVAAVVRVMDVLDEDVDLTPGRYVRAAVDADRTADAAAAGMRELEAAIDDLRGEFGGLPGFEGIEERTWRTATVADLAKGGALEVHLARSRRDEETTSDDRHLGAPVLTTRDLVADSEPSGIAEPGSPAVPVVIEPGDVVIPLLRGIREERPRVRVAGNAEAGALIGTNVFLLRPTPGRLDPWFLAGFVASPENTAATVGATTIRVVPSRLRIPLLPLDQQQRYGAMFQRLHRLRHAARRADRSAARLTGLLGTGVTAGALEPHDLLAADAERLPEGRK